MAVKKFLSVFAGIIFLLNFSFQITLAKPVEVEPHIFVDVIPQNDWTFNGANDILFVGYGSPLFPKKKSHYILCKTIQFGYMKDGRLVIKCNFKDMYEFAVFYQEKKADSSYRAKMMMGDTVNKNKLALEVDSVLAKFNDQLLEPFPNVGENLIPYRVAEMLYFIVKGEKYYGDLNPQDFLNIKDKNVLNIVNPYTQDLYEQCKLFRKK